MEEIRRSGGRRRVGKTWHVSLLWNCLWGRKLAPTPQTCSRPVLCPGVGFFPRPLQLASVTHWFTRWFSCIPLSSDTSLLKNRSRGWEITKVRVWESDCPKCAAGKPSSAFWVETLPASFPRVIRWPQRLVGLVWSIRTLAWVSEGAGLPQTLFCLILILIFSHRLSLGSYLLRISFFRFFVVVVSFSTLLLIYACLGINT